MSTEWPDRERFLLGKRDISDKPFVLFCRLVMCDLKGDYESAIAFRDQLAKIGWNVSRTAWEDPKPTRRKRCTTTAKGGAA